MVSLSKMLEIPDSDYSKYKIHFASVDSHDPLEEFLLGNFKEYQEKQTKKNFNREYVISLISHEKDIWMFAGVYKVQSEPVLDTKTNLYIYDTELTTCQDDLIGRLYFKYKKEFRHSYPNLESVPKHGGKPSNMELLKIEENIKSIQDFPGFDNVNISYDILKIIIDDELASWKNTLSKAKGIYLIIDTTSGKQYVGSAYGESAIWQRWSQYAKNGHGGNKELKELLLKKGNDHKTKFQYSILEISNLNTSDIYIYERETHWKEVLMTRDFGLNSN
jgi:hypothetical protein